MAKRSATHKGPTAKKSAKPAPKAKAATAKAKAKPAAKPSKPAAKPSKASKAEKPKTHKAHSRPSSSAGSAPSLRQPPPPPPLATPKPPSPDAVAAFERGMAEVQRHDYRGAARTFQRLVDDFPAEGFLADRARVYLQLAQRELERRPAAEGGVEERLTAATAALNEDDVATAERLAESVRREDDSLDLAPYLLAIVAMRKSDHDTAMTFLRKAIALNPENRIQARQDEEFDALFNLDEFHTLTETPADDDPSGLMGLAGRRPAKRGK